MIEIDGSAGEGGGQVLRTALALSLVTGQPFRIVRIRAKRDKPGLLRQHLTAVLAAAEIGGADVEGAEIGSGRLVFAPGEVRPGAYRFAIGTAGSTMLVLQAVLPALLQVGLSTLRLEGGTHNPWAPPYDFLAGVYLPLLRRMGARLEDKLLRHGFHPAGGGIAEFRFPEPSTLHPLALLERGATRRRRAVATVAKLSPSIAERELAVLRRGLGLGDDECEVQVVRDSQGPGNVVTLTIESEHVTEVFTAFGERDRGAEAVANDVVQEARAYLAADVPVASHLADQLVLPMALAGGGSFRTLALSQHARTNAEILQLFLSVRVDTTDDSRTPTVTVHSE